MHDTTCAYAASEPLPQPISISELTCQCHVQALLALLLPTHFLYAFLYYTDMGAATFLLASYLVGSSAHAEPLCIARAGSHSSKTRTSTIDPLPVQYISKPWR